MNTTKERLPFGANDYGAIPGVRGFELVPRDGYAPSRTAYRRAEEALDRVMRVIENPRGNVRWQVTTFRKYVPELVKYAEEALRRALEYYQIAKETAGADHENAGKRWTQAQDVLLIEAVSQGANQIQVSQMLGRSPSACVARVSYLVGINRISKKVAGEFTGWVGSEFYDGVAINGEVSNND